jgi:hypothetical protein
VKRYVKVYLLVPQVDTFEVVIVDSAEFIVFHKVLHEGEGDWRRGVAKKSGDDEVHALNIPNRSKILISKHSQYLLQLNSPLLSFIKVLIIKTRSINVLLYLSLIILPLIL